MKKISLVLLISLFSSILFAQKIKMSKAELKTKLDSVLAEGNLLYKYEKAAWISNDLAFECPAVKAEYNGFFTYEEQEEIKTIILGYKVTKLSHSHLRTTPLMTATDICTFMLYAPLYGMDEFSVYSPAIGKHMNYSLTQITH